REALESLDFLVVQDIFMNDTTRLADVVLPAAAFAEVDGTFTNTERRVQRVRKAVESPGEARPDCDILLDLFDRMGAPQALISPAEVWAEAAALSPLFAGISYERLEAEGGIQWPCPAPDHPGTPYLHKGELESGLPGQFMPVDHIPPAEEPDDEYPLVLTTGRRRSTYHTGTQTGRASGFELLVPHELVEINPADAEGLGVADGEMVKIASRRGAVEAHAKVTDRSPEGAVFMSFAFPESTLTNVLTNDAFDFITETPEYKACAVRVEKLGVSEAAARD
ncbi:MAG: molybdopterin dinucleotide binding domain-containing protein, partial [Dehalococcoidia bacterium]